MNRTKLKLLIILTIFSFLWGSAFSYASSSGRNTVKNNSGVIFVARATRLAAKSYAIKRYGRNIKILSNRFSKNVFPAKSEEKKYICRKVVLKTRHGDRKTLRVCASKIYP